MQKSRKFCCQYTVKKLPNVSAQHICIKLQYFWSTVYVKLCAELIREMTSSYFGHIKFNISILCADVLNIYTETIKGWDWLLSNTQVTSISACVLRKHF